jgi:hypothetical protein
VCKSYIAVFTEKTRLGERFSRVCVCFNTKRTISSKRAALSALPTLKRMSALVAYDNKENEVCALVGHIIVHH